jgi:hypothetical protein
MVSFGARTLPCETFTAKQTDACSRVTYLALKQELLATCNKNFDKGDKWLEETDDWQVLQCSSVSVLAVGRIGPRCAANHHAFPRLGVDSLPGGLAGEKQ